MFFASDNASGAAPEIIDAVVRANSGYAASYGADAAMERVTARIRTLFEAPRAAVHLVATGTASNAISLACLCPPWATIYCHTQAHVQVDECGAPEFYSGGAKLTPLAGADGRIDPAALTEAVAAAGEGNVHSVRPGALTLTNATEAGTVYDPDAIRALSAAARRFGLPVHVDGARFANALVHLGCTPAEATWKAGVDVLSLGGTKNGCLGVEAIVLFEPERSWELELRRKRGGHLFSKHRFLSAQMEAWLTDDLWLVLARRANARAAELARGLAALPGSTLVFPVEANAVFATLPRALHRAAFAAGARYYLWPADQSLDGPDGEPLSARFVCSWSTEADDVAALVAAFARAAEPAAG